MGTNESEDGLNTLNIERKKSAASSVKSYMKATYSSSAKKSLMAKKVDDGSNEEADSSPES